MDTFRLGEVSITRVVEIGRSFYPTADMLPESTAEAIARHHGWLKPDFFDAATGDLGSRIQTWVVRMPGRTILIDTGVGNGKERHESPLWHHRQGTWLDDLAAAGVTPEQVDTVVCTHLHVDHVGWNTMLVEGRWVPTFPRARYLFGRVEFEHWSTQTERADMLPVFADSIRPIFDRGLADLVEWDHQICPEIRLMPSTGHTPGHASVLISSNGKRAMITGDFAHHPCQMAHPEWSSTADWDAATAEATRRRIFGELAGEPVLVIGTHFAGPTAGHVARDGNTFKLVV